MSRRDGGGPRARSAVNPRPIGGVLAAAIALALGVLAAWPIYQTARTWLVAAAALILGAGLAWARERWRLNPPVFLALALAAFVLTLVPVAVPQALGGGFLRGLVDGLAAVPLGWKQLLTLTLPVGSYRTVLVPLYLVLLVTALLVVLLAQRTGKSAALAAIPMLAPIAFGTVFGSSHVSAPLALGPVSISAPREIALWCTAIAAAATWIVWTAGAERRAALRLGRSGDEPELRRGRALRVSIGGVVVVTAILGGLVLAPVLDAGARAVPRDGVEPELVIRERPSPLASYRDAKRDENLDRVMFTVAGGGSGSRADALPPRLRLAVLDRYDGVDFHVGDDAAARFIRFPSGRQLERPARVSIEVGEGYRDIWVPTATLGTPPSFSGPRADALADAFYVNPDTDAAIGIPDGDSAQPGLRPGDGYSAEMETAPQGGRLGQPVSNAPLIDAETVPQLDAWVERQELGRDAEGLAELITRLRDRGYLSHSLTDDGDRAAWISRLAEQYGTRFFSSPGGHSLSRVEALFTQLNDQQEAAGEKASAEQLVAGVGDDEQFAAAAALVARLLGYDSRVVVGFRLGAAGGEEAPEVPGVPNCEQRCTGDNLAAWIEVRGDRGDWVPFDVTPQAELPPQTLQQGEQLPEHPTLPEERDAQEVDPPLGLDERGGGEQRENTEAEAAWLWPVLRGVGLGSAALLLVILPIAFLPLAKRRRAKRRRAEPEPELRALGAWEEMVDRARDAGVLIPAGATRSGIAASLGTAPAAWAAEQTDRAVFGPHGIDEAAAEMVWQAAEADRDERESARTRGARLRARYSLRSYGIELGRRRERAAGSGGGIAPTVKGEVRDGQP